MLTALVFLKTRRITPRIRESALAFSSFGETARVNYIDCQLAVRTADLSDTLVVCLGLCKTERITARSQESALAYPSFTETTGVNYIVCQLLVRTTMHEKSPDQDMEGLKHF